MSKKRAVIVSVAAVVIVVLALQLVPVHRDNPPPGAALDAPPDVVAVLSVACADCHSHDTRWPWYSRVAPVSWLVAHDVEEAREHLNLSTWDSYEPEKQVKLREEMWEEVDDGEMPPALYRLAHSDARLDEAAKKVLHDWAMNP